MFTAVIRMKMGVWFKRILISLVTIAVILVVGFFVVVHPWSTEESVVNPVFVTIEPMTVNLQSNYGDRYLHAAITLELHEKSEMTIINNYLPQIKNKILLMLSAKQPVDIARPEQRVALALELKESLNRDLSSRATESPIESVLFTAFIIQ